MSPRMDVKVQSTALPVPVRCPIHDWASVPIETTTPIATNAETTESVQVRFRLWKASVHDNRQRSGRKVTRP
jgi:hypothetical protein